MLADTMFMVSADPRLCKEIYRACPQEDSPVSKESWYRDAILQNPSLVIEPCRKAELTDEEWFPWAHEVSLSSQDGTLIGRADVLLFSETGRVSIVETKLAKNPEKRREVIAQLLDYAFNLRYNCDSLPELPPFAMSSSLSKPPDIMRDHVIDRVKKGDYLLILAGDRLDDRAVKLATGLSEAHALLGWTMAAVELSLYSRCTNDASEREHILIPHFRSALVPATRSVFAVHVDIDSTTGGMKGFSVDTKRPDPDVVYGQRREWDEGSFFEDASKRLSDDKVAVIKVVHETAKRLGQVFYGSGNARGSFTLKFDFSQRGPLSLYSDGKLQLKPGWMRNSKAGELYCSAFLEQLNRIGISLDDGHNGGERTLLFDEWAKKSTDLMIAVETALVDARKKAV